MPGCHQPKRSTRAMLRRRTGAGDGRRGAGAFVRQHVLGIRRPRLLYSVPLHFLGDELIVTAVGDNGPVDVARHDRSHPGHPFVYRRPGEG